MRLTTISILILMSGFAWADHHEGNKKPAFFTSQTSTMAATVDAIDHEARLVTLRKPDGSSVTFTPSPDVRNLDQVSVGDVLHVEYSQSVSIQVTDDDGIEPASGGMTEITRSKEGQMPALVAVDTSVVLANVVAIDLEGQTYQLRFVDGSINEYVAMNPENLKMAAIGDVVSVKVTESVIAEVLKIE
ncbi:MAG: hypothetical protein ACR2Q3_01705 [Woeseiaceae bacterium]